MPRAQAQLHAALRRGLAVVAVAALLAAGCAHTRVVAGAESVCVTRGRKAGPDAPAVELVLDGMKWKRWRRFCSRLVRFLDVAPPPYTAADLEQIEQRLVAPGYFAAASCEAVPAEQPQQEEDGASGKEPLRPALSCRVEPRRIVKSVDITGDVPFPLLERDLRRRVFVRSGSLVEEEHSGAEERQVESMERYLQRQGFFGARVRMKHLPVGGAPPNLGIEVQAEIGDARTYEIGRLGLEGSPVLKQSEARDELTHYWIPWVLEQRFRPEQLRDDVAELESELRERGWPGARLDASYELDDDTGLANVRIEVVSGPRLELEITGNRTVSDEDLREVATFAEAGALDPIQVERVREAMVQKLQEKGFYEPQVEAEREELGTNVVRVRYIVDEGPRAEVERVRFEGNESIPADVIQDEASILTDTGGLFHAGRWVDAWVLDDIRSIERLYRERGFLEAQVRAHREVLKPGELAATFTIEEGPRRVVRSLGFVGLPGVFDEQDVEARLPMGPGDAYQEELLEGQINALQLALAAQGYLNGTVEQRVDAPPADEGGWVYLRYTIDAGERSSLSGFLVRGNFRTRRSVIAQELDIEPGEPLDVVAVAKAERRLRDLGIFTSVEVDRATDEPRVDPWLLVAVEERSAIGLDAAVAYTTDYRFSIGLDYQDRNLLGRALALDVSLRLSNASEVISPSLRIGDSDRINAQLLAPHPFGLPFNLRYGAYYRFDDQELFQERLVGGSVAVDRVLVRRTDCAACPNLAVAGGYQLSSTWFEGTPDDPVLRLQDNAAVGELFTSLQIDRTDSVVDPREGYTGTARASVALAALALGLPDATTFARLVFSAGGYLPLGVPLELGKTREGGTRGGPVVIAAGSQYGLARPFGGTSTLPTSQVFFYGGDSSVRGTEARASLVGAPDAQSLLTATVELRWYFLQNLSIGAFQVAAFMDLGTVGDDAASVFDLMTISVGPALRYITPVGPLSIAYGWPIMRPDAVVELEPSAIPASGRFHFAFGPTF